MHSSTVYKPIIDLMCMWKGDHYPCSCRFIRCQSCTLGDCCKLCGSQSWRIWTLLCPMSFASTIEALCDEVPRCNFSMPHLTLFLCSWWSPHSCSRWASPNILPLTPTGSSRWSILLVLTPTSFRRRSKKLPTIVRLCLPSKKRRLNSGFSCNGFCTYG